MPSKGRISGVFGSQRILNDKPSPHKGLDIAAPEGTKIVAPSSGKVKLIQRYVFTGNTIIIDHGRSDFNFCTSKRN